MICHLYAQCDGTKKHLLEKGFLGTMSSELCIFLLGKDHICFNSADTLSRSQKPSNKVLILICW